MQRTAVLVVTILLLLMTVPTWAGSYQYIQPTQLKLKLAGPPLQLLDIQVEQEFNQQHIQGALATYAYPVKSASDRTKLDATIAQLQQTEDAVVIICPGGGGGAKRAHDYLLEQGIAKERLFILEKGQQGWPYPELLAQK